jgi:hypothetical protein
MYIKECKWCKKLISVEKQQGFASHVACCDENPNFEKRKENLSKLFKGCNKVDRVLEIRNCLRCNTKFEVEATISEFERDKNKQILRKYCSDKCSRQRTLSEETKSKIRNSLILNGNMFTPPKRDKKIIQFTCLKCGECGVNQKYREQKYHKKCWLEISGGIKKGSSRGKSGWYKGYWLDSSYELAYLIYCIDHNIKIERNKKGFEYFYKNKKHLFYPDFIVNDEYVEIKNFESDLTNAKISYFPYEIKVIYKKDIKIYLDYVVGKYGKNFISLYE